MKSPSIHLPAKLTYYFQSHKFYGNKFYFPADHANFADFLRTTGKGNWYLFQPLRKKWYKELVFYYNLCSFCSHPYQIPSRRSLNGICKVSVRSLIPFFPINSPFLYRDFTMSFRLFNRIYYVFHYIFILYQQYKDIPPVFKHCTFFTNRQNNFINTPFLLIRTYPPIC